MLQVLTAQIVAEERERAIQRRLREGAVRREATLAATAAAVVPGVHHGPNVHSSDARCGACPPAAAGAC
jgi:hypothetical protein